MKTINIKGKDVHNMKKHWDTRGRTGTITKNGYRVFSVGSRENKVAKYEHRIVWEKHFGEIPEGFDIHHKDGNKQNNCIENLELISSSEHRRIHAIKNNLGKKTGIEPTNKTPKEIINKVIELRKSGKLLSEIMDIVGLSYPTVQKYAKGV